MTYNANGGFYDRPDPSGFNHPEGYSSYDSGESGFDQSGYEQPQYRQDNYGLQAYGQQPYGQQSYGQPGTFGGQAVPQQTNNMALAALIVGIVSLVCIILFPLGLLLGLVAIVLGVMGIRRAKAIEETNQYGVQTSRRGLAIGGLVTGIIATVISAVILILGIQLMQAVVDSGMIEACEPYVRANDNEGLQECLERELENNPNFPNP